MRPLNRPMFRYGGPIKEGIMDGMREPLKNGKIVGGKQSPLLAGAHPLKDAEGREQHFIPALYAAGIGALNIGRAGLAAARIAGPAIKKGFQAARAFGATPGKLGFFGRAKDLAKIRPGIGLPMATRPESIGFRIGSFAKQNPILSASIPSLSYDAARIGLPLAGEALKGVANFLVPGTALDPFGRKKDDLKTTDDGTGIKRGDPNKDKVVPSPDTGGTGGKSDAEKQIINEDRINETKQKYYKLMGLDNMKKDAVYDSLIDASRIVSEEGADLKGSIKSGALQNRLIQAIGKNLDKSADLKKAIDSAVLKGEIQKDINLTKPSAFAEQVEYIRNNPDDPLAKKLSGMTSVADNLAALADKPITSDIVARLVTSKGTEIEDIVKDDKYQKWEKNNENKDEIDYLQEITKGGSLDAGIYIVNKKAIRIDEEGSAFPIDLDSIIG